MKLASLIVFTLAVLAGSVPPTSHTQTAGGPQGTKRIIAPPPRPQSPPIACSTCGGSEDKPHTLAASYYSVKDGNETTLLINNKGPKPIEINPTLFSLAGHKQELLSITVDGLGFREIDMRDFGISGTAFEQGSLQLFHRGKDLVIGAQVRVSDETRSHLFEEKLLEISSEIGTQQLQGIWYLPSIKGRIRLVLSNTSHNEVPAEVRVDGVAPKHRDPLRITLAAHETRIINVENDIDGRQVGTVQQVGGVTVQHESANGSILARLLMDDQSSGYSSSVRFFDSKKAKSTKLHGAGLRLKDPDGNRLTTVIVARNVSSQETEITGRVPYTNAYGQVEELFLPALKLKPGESKLLNSARLHSESFADIVVASLEFAYTGEPGDVIMSAQTMNHNGDLSFQVPLWDIKAQRSSTGGYPWALEDSLSTFVYIKNVTDHKQEYVLEVISEGGGEPYSPGLKSLEAGETVALDIRKLRDQQIPDEFGRKIPSTATHGQIQWSMRGLESLPLVGRAEQVDLAKRWSFSYSCQNCCGDQPWNWGMSSSPESILNFGDAGFAAFEGMTNCYGYEHGPYQVYPSTWWVEDEYSPDLLLAGVDSAGLVTSNFSGQGTVFAAHETYWVSGDGLSCWQNPFTDVLSAALSILSPVHFINASSGGNSAIFPPPPANFTNLTVDCSGATFRVRVKFEPPADSTECCQGLGSFVKLFDPPNNKFFFVNDLIEDAYVVFYANDNPPMVDIYMKRKAGNVGTQNKLGITIDGTRVNGSPYSGTAVVRMQCD